MATMLAPMARWMSTPKMRVKTGVTSRPPPIPTIAPIAPAAIDVRNMKRRKNSGDVVLITHVLRLFPFNDSPAAIFAISQAKDSDNGKSLYINAGLITLSTFPAEFSRIAVK